MRVGYAVVRGGERVAASVGDPVVDGALHLAHQREHGAQHFAEWRQVILRHPRAKFEELVAEKGLVVQNRFNRLGFELRRRFGTLAHNHADELFVAKGDNHPKTAPRLNTEWHLVGECPVERERQGDFAELGHGRLGPILSVVGGPGAWGKREFHLRPAKSRAKLERLPRKLKEFNRRRLWA